MVYCHFAHLRVFRAGKLSNTGEIPRDFRKTKASENFRKLARSYKDFFLHKYHIYGDQSMKIIPIKADFSLSL